MIVFLSVGVRRFGRMGCGLLCRRYGLFDKDVAKGELHRLVGWLWRSRNVHMKKLAGIVVNHFENILNYFDDRLTNAVLEGLNNVVQSIKHTARGFRNCDYMKVICYLHCGAFEVTAT